MSEPKTNPTSPEAISAGHEPDSGDARQIAIAVAALSLLAVAALAVVWGISLFLQADQPTATPAVTPRLEFEPFTKTELSADQPAALRELRDRESAQLTTYGWIDRDANIARIPIERAIEIVGEQGLPNWPAAPEQPPTPESR
jgi:hypothetical protein